MVSSVVSLASQGLHRAGAAAVVVDGFSLDGCPQVDNPA